MPNDFNDETLQKCHKRHHLRLSRVSPTPLRGSQEWELRNGSWKGPRAPRPRGGGGPFGGPGVKLWLSIGSRSDLRHNWSIGHSYGQSESNTQTRAIGGA